MKKFALLFLVVILLAVFLRVYDLGRESVWIDEGFALENADRPVMQVVGWVKEFDPITPLYYVTLHFWINGFGNSEFNTRLLSVIFNLLTLPVFYLFVRKLLDQRAALAASLFFASSMLQVQYSQEARSYAMFSFFAWLSTLIFIYIVADRKKWFVPYTLAAVISGYVMQFGFFVMALHGMFLLLRQRDLLKKWLVSFGVVLLAFAPWMPVFFTQVGLVNHLFQQALSVRMGLPGFISRYFLASFFALSILCAAVFSLVYPKKERLFLTIFRKVFQQKIFVPLLVFALASYIYLLPHLVHSVFIVRYLFFLLPVAYLAFAFGIMNVTNRRLMAVLVLLVLLVNIFALFTYYSETTKPEWKAAIAYIDENSEEGEIALLDTGYSKMLFDYYNAKTQTIGLIKRHASLQDNQQFLEQITAELKTKKGVWLVLARNFLTKELYKAALDQDPAFKLSSSKDFYGVRVYYYPATSGHKL